MTQNEDASEAKLLQRAYDLTGDSVQTKALYRDWAQSYDDTMMDGLAYRSPMLVAAKVAALGLALGLATGARILDVGCGTGLLADALVASGSWQLTGLDYSQEMIDQAAEKGLYVDFHVADLNQPLALESSRFEAIVSIGTFTHGHVGAGCLGELNRLLVPGGVLIATVHHDVWAEAGFEAAFEESHWASVSKDAERLFETDEAANGWIVSAVKG